MNILIADDHAVVRKGIRQIITEEFPGVTITEVSNGQEMFDHSKSGDFDVIISDMSMPGKNALEVIKDLHALDISTPVIILSIHPEDQYAVRVLKAGGAGYLTKESAPDELVKAIHMVTGGKKYISGEVAEQLLLQVNAKYNLSPHERLSDREFSVMKLIASGKTVSEIAGELHLSVATISTYRARIIEKTGFKSNAEMTRYAISNKIV